MRWVRAKADRGQGGYGESCLHIADLYQTTLKLRNSYFTSPEYL